MLPLSIKDTYKIINYNISQQRKAEFLKNPPTNISWLYAMEPDSDLFSSAVNMKEYQKMTDRIKEEIGSDLERAYYEFKSLS